MQFQGLGDFKGSNGIIDLNASDDTDTGEKVKVRLWGMGKTLLASPSITTSSSSLIEMSDLFS
jgi:hypothetical protein